jgi:alpha-beta hydrolase superfamily lysophospholipase
MRRGYRNAAITFAIGLSLILALFPLLLGRLERAMISTGPNGPETPATVGLAYEHVKIPSGRRLLDAYLVEASSTCRSRAALLVFHGVGETISQWVNVQRVLHDRCISSLVFDYSGNGDSSPPGTVANLREDAIAAYGRFEAQFAASSRLCILGFSMGNAVLLDAYTEFHPAPECIIVGSAFSSAREGAAHAWGIPRWMVHALPDQWDNVRAVSRSHSPLLVLHSDADQANPLWMGERIYQAAPQPKRLVILHGLPHNAAYRGPIEQWWEPAITFVEVPGTGNMLGAQNR